MNVRVLDTPLAQVNCSSRLEHVIRARDLATLRDLVVLDPRTLRSHKGLGRATVAEVRAVVEAFLGVRWEEARARLTPPADAAATPRLIRCDAPRATSSADHRNREAALAIPTCHLAFSTRLVGFMSRRRLRLMRDLIPWTPARLAEQKNVGRTSIRHARTIVESVLMCTWEQAASGLRPKEFPEPWARLAASPGVLQSRPMNSYPDFLAWWRAGIEAASPEHQHVVRHRCCDGVPQQSLKDLGRTLTVTKERARQIECDGLAALRVDRKALRERISKALSRDRSRLLADLVREDAWFLSAAQAPVVFQYALAHLSIGWSLQRVDGDWVISRVDAADVNDAWRALRHDVAALCWPAPQEEIHALLEFRTASLGSAIRTSFARRIDSMLITDPSNPSVILGKRGLQASEILAAIGSAGSPVRSTSFWPDGKHGKLPPGVVNVDHQHVTRKWDLEGFDCWVDKLALLCVAWMRQMGPDRLWSCVELEEHLRDTGMDLPDWMGLWTLKALLAESGKVRTWRKLIVSLPHIDRDRPTMHNVLHDILRRAKKPVDIDTLRGRAQQVRYCDELVKRDPLAEGRSRSRSRPRPFERVRRGWLIGKDPLAKGRVSDHDRTKKPCRGYGHSIAIGTLPLDEGRWSHRDRNSEAYSAGRPIQNRVLDAPPPGDAPEQRRRWEKLKVRMADD